MEIVIKISQHARFQSPRAPTAQSSLQGLSDTKTCFSAIWDQRGGVPYVTLASGSFANNKENDTGGRNAGASGASALLPLILCSRPGLAVTSLLLLQPTGLTGTSPRGADESGIKVWFVPAS